MLLALDFNAEYKHRFQCYAFLLCSFPRAKFVSALGALEALYVPLEIREAYPEKQTKV